MPDKYNENFEIINDIYLRHNNCLELYDQIKSSNCKVLMSKDYKFSLYGMFLPHEDFEYSLERYKGRLTNNPNNMNFRYYFDDQDRVIMTERYGKEPLRNNEFTFYDIVFYFYYENRIEFVRYLNSENAIFSVALIECSGDKISRTLESEIIYSVLYGFDNFVERKYSYEEDGIHFAKHVYSSPNFDKTVQSITRYRDKRS